IPFNVDLHYDYARQFQDELKFQCVRVSIDDRNEKMGYKIREAQMQKIPYQIVVGDKEVENNQVNVRQYGSQEVGNEIGEKLTSEEVIDELRKGGAYESKLETDPKRKIDDKIKKLNDVYKNCNGYIAKIKQSI
ncbi:His/Gly/Thr/Pro-type tRNA ligase C-terminal domain-containing protein, partial [Staphylococcus aureus]|uniref:His/Gly/Thr/Pro-type tRNA ligase C-terminal domain-containing protein n=1 Tax=Staphylococcus aureus TaxID=1280 RepID=UPI002109239B